jgi:membrane protease YdiL (CAAX protease family)
VIAYSLPALPLALLHLGPAKNGALSIQRELPAKAVTTFLIILATLIVSRRDDRPLAALGVPLRQSFGRRFWEGSVWGFAMLSLILLTLRFTGHFRIDSFALTDREIPRYALAWAAVFLGVAFSEELAFRGYLLFSFSRALRFWRAALLLSFMFAAAHLGNHGENVPGILQVFGTGLLFCFMIRRTGNLWFAIGYHATWDWAETFFYGTPDSGLLGLGRLLNTSAQGPAWLTGASAGPEGSILAILALLLCALLLHFRFPHALYPDRPL